MNALSGDLHQFLAGYFHQDWTLDHPTASDAVHAFVAAATHDERSIVARELEDLLRLPDENLAAAINDLGACYDPLADGLTVREWVESLIETILPTS